MTDNSQAYKAIENLQQSMRELARMHSQVISVVEQLFQVLREKKVRFNIDASAIANKLHVTRESLEIQTKDVQAFLELALELARTSALISASLDQQQVLQEVMDTVISLTKAERAYLMLRTPGSDDMTTVAARNWERETLSDDDVMFSLSVVNTALEKGETIVLEDATADERFKSKESIHAFKLRSILCIPLILRGEIIGVLYADSQFRPGIFKRHDIPILNAFAQQTAIAIENARLYRELERANVQLMEANRLKSEFLGVISHELKTPFSAIGLATQVFQRASTEQLNPQQAVAWEDLTSGVEHAQQLVNSLVNYAGLLSKQGQLNLQRVNIAVLIDEVVSELQMLVARKKLRLEVDVEADLILLQGDYERISEALWHLIQNAIQYNKPNGQIVIRASHQSDYVRLEVEDTGRGIAPEQQDRIWQDFEQMSDSLRRGVEGLGLGLPLVRYVAVAHGGTVELESEPGVGSRFTMWLPLTPT